MKIAQQPTACDAFHALVDVGVAATQRELIRRFIERRGGAWSIGELAAELSMQKSTVSARVNEMVFETRELVAKPKRKDRMSNITVRPVGLPPMQQELFAAQGALFQ